MARSVWPRAFGVLALAALSGCGWLERAERPAWRTQAENLCLSRGLVKPSAYVEPQPEIDGPGICGLTHPFRVSALADGTVSIDKTVTMDCSMIPALEAWLADVVQPSAQARFGANVVGLEAFGAYSCRSRRQYRRRATVGARVRQRHRRRRLQARRRARDQHRARLEEGRQLRNRRSCTRFTPAPASASPPCSGPAPTCSTTTISISIWRCTARPTPARAAIAGRNPRPDLMPAPARPDGLPPAPEIEEPMDVARAASRPSSGPLVLQRPLRRAAAAAASLRQPPGAAADPAGRRRRVDRPGADLGDRPLARRLTRLAPLEPIPFRWNRDRL